jgi:hypothetical protein
MSGTRLNDFVELCAGRSARTRIARTRSQKLICQSSDLTDQGLLSVPYPGVPQPLGRSSSFSSNDSSYPILLQRLGIVPNRAGTTTLPLGSFHTSGFSPLRQRNQKGAFEGHMLSHTIPRFENSIFWNESCFPANALPLDRKRHLLNLTLACEQRRHIELVSWYFVLWLCPEDLPESLRSNSWSWHLLYFEWHKYEQDWMLTF